MAGKHKTTRPQSGGRLFPSYFVRSGDVNLNNAALRYSGLYGNGWSQIATVYGNSIWNAGAYFLDFSASGINTSNNYVRWYAFPVRCLV